MAGMADAEIDGLRGPGLPAQDRRGSRRVAGPSQFQRDEPSAVVEVADQGQCGLNGHRLDGGGLDKTVLGEVAPKRSRKG